jgi:ribosomal protein L7/L12
LPAPATAPAELFDVVMVDPGSDVITLVREMRDAANIPLREASEVARGRRPIVKQRMTRVRAEALQKRLADCGAKVELQPYSNTPGSS